MSTPRPAACCARLPGIGRMACFVLLAAVLWPSAAARADSGTGQREAAAARGDGPEDAAQESAAAWLRNRRRELAVEARTRAEEAERMRQRLERDLLGLRRARLVLLRCGGAGPLEPEREDPVLVEADGIRGRVTRAAASARREMASAAASIPRSVARREAPVPAAMARAAQAARISAGLHVTKMRMARASRAFGQVVVVERKRVARLAAESARVAEALLQAGAPGADNPASTRRVTDAQRALSRLKKLGSEERRKIRQHLVRDARRLRETQRAVAGIEARMQALQREVRRLRAAGRHPEAAAGRTTGPRGGAAPAGRAEGVRSADRSQPPADAGARSAVPAAR